jgi:hypothetical protein
MLETYDDGMQELCSAMTALAVSANSMEGDMPEVLEDSIVHQGLPDGFGLWWRICQR